MKTEEAEFKNDLSDIIVDTIVSEEKLHKDNQDNKNNHSNNDVIIADKDDDSSEHRSEESWSEENTRLLLSRLTELKKQSKIHNICGYKKKKLNVYIGLPATIIPIVMASLSSLFQNVENFKYVEVVMYIISGILSGTMSFFNPKASMERHFQYESKFSDLVTDIETELAKAPKFRCPSDVFNLKIQLKMDSLLENAPIPAGTVVKQVNNNLIH